MAGHSKQLGGAGPCQACLLGTPLFETTVSRFSYFSVRLFLFYVRVQPIYILIILELFLPKLWPIFLKIMPEY